LLSCQVKPLHDFFYGGACFKILEDDGDAHTSAFEKPRAADLYLFAGQCGYQCALNNVKWVMKGGECFGLASEQNLVHAGRV
jgi:hypothetical protein